MDWQLKSMAGKSSASETEFKPGDAVVSLIFKDTTEGVLARADVLSEELESFELSGPRLGQWRRIIKEESSNELAPQEQMVAAEDLFLSLFESQENEEASVGEAERLALQHLLALLLERKRILRSLGIRAKDGLQRYRHAKLDREFEVPVLEVDGKLMEKIMETMGDVFLQR
jgi:hypothetical protein